MGTSPPRPAPARPGIAAARDRMHHWYQWFGPGRVLVAAVSAVAVVAGGAWLLRVPPMPVHPAPALVGEAPVFTLAPLLPGTADSTPVEVVVHVAGAVWRPGVFALAPGSRVIDAVEAAGGTRTDAVVDALNLASLVIDGQRIYVPVEGEDSILVVPAGHPPGITSEQPGRVAVVDLNRASMADLMTLPGVGPATANAIIEDRDRNGPFVDVDDLLRVRGIGPVKLDNLRELVST